MILELALVLQLRFRAQAVAPRVVLVILDDVAKEDLDEQRAAGLAPNIDYLATHGVEFANAQANPICQPSRVSMHWGDWHAQRVGNTCDGYTGVEPSLAFVSLPTLCGVPCAWFGKWDTGAAPAGSWIFTPQSYGYVNAQWMPHYVHDCGGHDYGWWPRVENGVSTVAFGLYQPAVMQAEANAWIDANPGPALVVYSAQLAHEPFHRPPGGFLPAGYPPTPNDRSKFLSMISALDHSVGRLLAHLTPDDIVIIVGDNGTPAEVLPAGVTGGKATTMDRGIHVPLIFAGAWIQPGTRDQLVHVADLYNTIGGLFGVPEDTQRAGRSLVPLLAGGSAPVHDYVFCGIEGDVRYPNDDCARSLLYKYRELDVDRDGIVDQEQFFVEPDETVDHIADPSFATEVAAHRAWMAANRP